MKIYLDDIRKEPKGWVRCYTTQEAIELIETNEVTEMSLDHDLGEKYNVGCGYDVLTWLEEEVATHNRIPPIIHIHTSNPSARIKMENAVVKIQQLSEKNKSSLP